MMADSCEEDNGGIRAACGEPKANNMVEAACRNVMLRYVKILPNNENENENAATAFSL
jgi:hypothetical protein